MQTNDYVISISKQQLAELPPVAYPGRVVLVNNDETIATALDYLRRQPMVGVDTETRPSFKKGDVHDPALLQVSTDDICFLFRLSRTGLTGELADWLADSRCPKVGLSLKDDFHQLHRLRPFEPGGFTELQQVVKHYGIADASLSKIHAILFGQRISKKQRLTNWEAPQLTLGQMHYAALDAWACLKIYKHLEQGLFDQVASPYKVFAGK